MWRRDLCLGIAVWRLICGLTVAVAPWSNLVSELYGWAEVATAWAAIVNTKRATQLDQRPIAWLAPLLYSLGFVAVPVAGESAAWVGCVLITVLALRVWAFWCLGIGYSVGVATWTRLADNGPYAWVRHPMQLSGLLARLVFCFANPMYWNWAAFSMMAVAGVGVVMVEESFLQRAGEWRRYSRRVRWRLLPRIW